MPQVAVIHKRRISLTRGATLAGYEVLARSVGLDPMRMVKEAGLPLELLANPDTLVSVDSVAKLLEESARRSNQEAFGLLLAEGRRLSNLGVLAAVVREEPTLRAALESLARYMCLQNGGLGLNLDNMGEFTLIRLELQLHKPAHSRQGIEMGAAIALRTLRALARENFDPVSICFCHGRPSRLEVHNRVLGARIDFTHSFDAIVCRSRALDLPIESADPELGAALKRRLDQQVIEPGDKPRDRVRQIVRVLIPSGECSVERVAQQPAHTGAP